MAIEAVIWDFGGVFTTSPFEAFNRYEAAHGLPKDLIRTVNATDPLENAWALFERAEINRGGFDMKFLEESTALGHPVRGADVLPLLAGDVRPRMVEALRICKRHYKVGCITNNMAQGHGPGMAANPEGASRSAGIMALFDVIVESSKAGVRKPDPRIYQMACEQMGVAPAACVYLDDLGINCKPAAALGMSAIKVVSEAQALDDLARVTGLVFPETVPA
ncbi:MAG TPA: HAD-IA family hydrolase [Caulobacteraceae bacterium]|nr:HAD-IA family hydrolase [Caulobacteraceae bacterium]